MGQQQEKRLRPFMGYYITPVLMCSYPFKGIHKLKKGTVRTRTLIESSKIIILIRAQLGTQKKARCQK